MKSAADLKKIALNEQAMANANMAEWVYKTCEAIINWCYEDASAGVFFTTIDASNFNSIFPSSVGKDMYLKILTLCKSLLEIEGYKVSIDDFDPISKFDRMVVNSITIDWKDA